MESVLDASAIYHDAYRFFDLDFVVRSDSPEVLDLLRKMYRRLWISDPRQAKATYYVIAGKMPFGNPALIVDGRTYIIDDPAILMGYTCTRIINSVVAKIRSHFLIHGGAVSLDSQGVILPANAGLGKTTLVLELVKRGFRFLSDDMAAMHRIDHRVYPFPKSLGIREDTFTVVKDLDVNRRTFLPLAGGYRKWILDVEDVRKDSVGKPCPARYVIVLTASLSEEEGQSGAGQVLYVVLNRASDALVADLKKIAGVKDIAVRSDRMFPILKFHLEKGAFIDLEVEELCYSHRVLMLDTLKGEERIPDFRASPELEPISNLEAATELVRKFRGGPRSVILRDEYQGNLALMFMDLLDIVADVRCYRLTVGKLDEMADLICRLVDGSGWPAA